MAPSIVIIDKAIEFATEKHAGQYRDDGVTPFLSHPAKTADILFTITHDPNLLAAAWLHDTLEDTDTTYNDLVFEFGNVIADLVFEVTKVDGKFPHLHSRGGILLKFADRLSNLSDMEGWSDTKQQAYLDKSRFW